MENELIIEVTGDGEFYQTRDGRKVRIYAVDGGDEYPIHGAILSGGKWLLSSWTNCGDSLPRNLEASDIMSKWQEPLDFDWEHNTLPWMNWIAMEESAGWFMYDEKPERQAFFWDSGKRYPIPSEYAPKNYNGNWKDSLRERPKA